MLQAAHAIKKFNLDTNLEYNHIDVSDEEINQFDSFLVVIIMNDEPWLKYYGLKYGSNSVLKQQLIAEINAVNFISNNRKSNKNMELFTLGLVLWTESKDRKYLNPATE